MVAKTLKGKTFYDVSYVATILYYGVWFEGLTFLNVHQN